MINKLTLLYVDDENANLLLFKVNLRNHFNIITAKSAKEALMELENNSNISLVISDLRMPNMSGMEFISHAHKNYPSIKYFILSGFEVSEEIKQYIEQKILTSYFSKPICFSQIIEKLNSFIQAEE